MRWRERKCDLRATWRDDERARTEPFDARPPKPEPEP